MPKTIRNYPVYLAPQILSYRNENGEEIVKDELTNSFLNPHNTNDKIKIYKRQVKGWFLDRASSLVQQNNSGFIVLMICLSYLEGVEQYRVGLSSRNQSCEFFRNAVNRLYPGVHNEQNLNELYDEARCGLFHYGMVKGKIIINYDYSDPISFPDPNTIKINPKKLLESIKMDFNNYLNDLNSLDNQIIRHNFDRMFNLTQNPPYPSYTSS